jgi:hypothetical protein
MSVTDIIFALSVLTILIPIIILFLAFNRQPVEVKWLAVFLCFSFSCDVMGPVLYWNGSNPNYAVTFYWLFSTILLSIFFLRIIQWQNLTRVFVVVNILYLIFATLNAGWIQKSSVNTYTVIVQSIIVLTLSILYFYKLLKELPTQQLQKLSQFWIVCGFFFTYAGKLVVYTVTYYVINFETQTTDIIWNFHNFLTIIANVLIGYGAWLNHKQLKSTSLSLSRS